MYEITIKKTEMETSVGGNDWKVVGEAPLSKDDVEEAHFSNHAEYMKKLKSVYGYTPKYEKQVEVSREVLKQTVEDLDLNSVIKAINRL